METLSFKHASRINRHTVVEEVRERQGPTCPHSPGIQRGGGQRPKVQRIRT